MPRTATAAERRLAEILERYQRQTLKAWRGNESVFLTELIRALDEAAFLKRYGGAAAPDSRLLWKACLGAAHALEPFMKSLRTAETHDIPWIPSDDHLAVTSTRYLVDCGRLAILLRIAHLERYGLCASKYENSRLVLEYQSDATERREVSLLREADDLISSGVAANAATPVTAEEGELLDRYVRVDREHFIAYENDWSLVERFRAIAMAEVDSFFEFEALPGDAVIGGRRFSEWRAGAAAAVGRVLQHIEFVARLLRRRPDLRLRNLLTVPVRRKDLIDVLSQAHDPAFATLFLKAMSLTHDSTQEYAADFEIPCPYYARVTEACFLLPIAGTLLNPIEPVVRHLRSTYRSEWDRAVLGREQIFRDDIRRAFEPPRFMFVERRARLYRSDGSQLTDIDAVLFDHQTGTLALIQLKWPDIHGRSLRQRHSQAQNIRAANTWVEKVDGWCEQRRLEEIARLVGVPPSTSIERIKLVILGRYAVRFVGIDDYDSRAVWMTWPELLANLRSAGPNLFQAEPTIDPSITTVVEPVVYNLPGLEVEVRPN